MSRQTAAGGESPAGGPTDMAMMDADEASAEEVAYPTTTAAPEPEMVPMGSGAAGGDFGGEVAARSQDAPPPEQGQQEAAAPQTWRRVTNASRFATVSLGGGETLELKKVRVTVQVEGMRARTVVDHIFFNPHARAVEGTFRYALPPESSVSSYAMFLGAGPASAQPDFFASDAALRRREEAMQMASVEQIVEQVDQGQWGELRVGRIVRAERGREVYEQVTRRRVDPALVEEVAPNTFEARVFPIQARGYNRVIVSYEQTLPRVGGELEYLFPVARGQLDSFDFTLAADRSLVRAGRSTGDLAGVREARAPGHLVYHAALGGESQGGTLAFRLTPATAQGPLEVLAGSHPERQEDHFLVRLTGDAQLPRTQGGYAEQAVFMMDTSLSEHPDRFNIDVALLVAILERSPGIRRFNVITFDAGARWLSRDWIDNTAEGRGGAVRSLSAILLEGATDVSAALGALASPPMQVADHGLDVFVLTDGAVSLGEREPGTLMARFAARSPWQARFFAYRTGLGAENLELLRRMTQGGATFNCLSTQSVPTCATAHHGGGLRVDRVAIEGTGAQPAAASDVLIAGGAATLSPGAELLIAGKITRPGTALLKVEGSVGGQRRSLSYPVTLTPRGTLASRAWAEIAVAHLLSTHDEDLEDLAVALSQHYRVPSRATSYLVLETDAEYEQYDLEAELRDVRGATIAELVAGATRQRGAARNSWERLNRILRTAGAHNRLEQIDGGAVYRTIGGFVAREPLDLLPGRAEVPAVLAAEAPEAYRRQISHEPDGLAMFRAEAERRHQGGQLGSAIRALSSVVENDPAGAEAARLTAYTLDSWGAHAEAAELLLNVLERRPYEPQSYRDLANALWTRRPSMTALLFEAVLAGQWDARFRGLQTVVREEYALFIRDWQRRGPRSRLAHYLTQREQALGLALPRADLRVTMTWNTDNTDIDLWVTDPEGEKCYYAHRNIASGGELLDDVTQGFGPERFQSPQADDGTYLIQAHYYGNNGNRLVAETHVTLTVATNVGTDQEQIRRFNVTLENPGDVATVARIRVR